jgi:hypothetical protein
MLFNPISEMGKFRTVNGKQTKIGQIREGLEFACFGKISYA